MRQDPSGKSVLGGFGLLIGSSFGRRFRVITPFLTGRIWRLNGIQWNLIKLAAVVPMIRYHAPEISGQNLSLSARIIGVYIV
jgi:hypothetical protein